MQFRRLGELELNGRRVFLRVDFNVPLDKETGRTITSDTRIRMALPTVRAILDRGAALVIASHLGRPKGQRHPRMSLAPVAERLAELLGRPVAFAPDCVGPEVETLARGAEPGEALLLENLRFHAEEEANDERFAGQLAALADAYVNDAFGAAHRAHASTVGVPGILPLRAAGLLMERELEYLSMPLSSPRHPYVAIVGGAKISGKIDVLRNLLQRADHVLIGGAMTYTFLQARGQAVGSSLVETEKVPLARELLDDAGGKIVLPTDHALADDFSPNASRRLADERIPEGWMGLDIGPETIARYEAIIGEAAMIVWNGPMGVFEYPQFADGTLAIAKAVERASAKGSVSIVGGGDSEQAIRAAGVGRQITHISTGGGASLEFLGGKLLPGVAALA